jgi:hypothetical protein
MASSDIFGKIIMNQNYILKDIRGDSIRRMLATFQLRIF